MNRPRPLGSSRGFEITQHESGTDIRVIYNVNTDCKLAERLHQGATITFLSFYSY